MPMTQNRSYAPPNLTLTEFEDMLDRLVLDANGSKLQVTAGDFNAWAKIGGIYVCSYYAPPSLTLAEFEDMLDKLVLDANGQKPQVIAGDFNAWATEWENSLMNARKRCLLEAFTQLDIILANDGQVNSYRKGESGAVVYLTFVSPSSARDISWNVSEQYTHSDHQTMLFDLKRKSRGCPK